MCGAIAALNIHDGQSDCAQEGLSDVVDLFLQHAADANAATDEGVTPLIAATLVRHVFQIPILFLSHKNGRQKGHAVVVSRLLRANVDLHAKSVYGTVREAALLLDRNPCLYVIDAHLQRQLRRCLANVCLALCATELPVLALIECFAWTAASLYANDHAHLSLDLQWRIAKLVRNRRDRCYRA